MGVRGELFSTKVILPNRTYFFNVKENRMGDLYLNVVESKNRESGGFDRQSVILFADDLQEFLKGFDESLRVLEKAVRDKRKPGGGKPAQKPPQRSAEYKDDKGKKSFTRDRPAKNRSSDSGYTRKTDHKTDRKPDRRTERKTERKPEGRSFQGKGKRVVVKKR
jgi:hypothetical protein